MFARKMQFPIFFAVVTMIVFFTFVILFVCLSSFDLFLFEWFFSAKTMFAGLAILLLAGCALLVIDGHNLSNIWANVEISYLGKLDLTQGILVDFSGCQSRLSTHDFFKGRITAQWFY